MVNGSPWSFLIGCQKELTISAARAGFWQLQQFLQSPGVMRARAGCSGHELDAAVSDPPPHISPSSHILPSHISPLPTSHPSSHLLASHISCHLTERDALCYVRRVMIDRNIIGRRVPESAACHTCHTCHTDHQTWVTCAERGARSGHNREESHTDVQGGRVIYRE